MDYIVEAFKQLNNLNESKQDEENLIQAVGENIAHEFLSRRNQLEKNDIYQWIKKDKQSNKWVEKESGALDSYLNSKSNLSSEQQKQKEIQDICNRGISDDVIDLGVVSGWHVYIPQSYASFIKYGLVVGGEANWCISGHYYNPNDVTNSRKNIVEEVEFYVNQYEEGTVLTPPITNFIFVIKDKSSDKFCICTSYDWGWEEKGLDEGEVISSIYNRKDEEVSEEELKKNIGDEAFNWIMDKCNIHPNDF